MQVILYARDLMSMSTIQGHVQGAGHSLRTVAGAAQLLEHVSESDLVLIDLNAVSEPLADVVRQADERRAAAADADNAPLRIWAYGPHVNEQLMQSAVDAGCELVLPRGQFLARLPQLLAVAARPAKP